MKDTHTRCEHVGFDPFVYAWARLKRIAWGGLVFIAAVGIVMTVLQSSGAVGMAQPVAVKCALVLCAMLYATSNTAVVLSALEVRCPGCHIDSSAMAWFSFGACSDCDLRRGFMPPSAHGEKALMTKGIYR